MENIFKEKLTEAFSDEQKRRNEISEFILLPTKRQLTEEEEKRYLSLDKSLIPNNILYAMYEMIKNYIETGEIASLEAFKKCIKTEPKKVTLEAISEEQQKDPRQIANKEEDDAR